MGLRPQSGRCAGEWERPLSPVFDPYRGRTKMFRCVPGVPRPLRGLNPGLLPCDAYGISLPLTGRNPIRIPGIRPHIARRGILVRTEKKVSVRETLKRDPYRNFFLGTGLLLLWSGGRVLCRSRRREEGEWVPKADFGYPLALPLDTPQNE